MVLVRSVQMETSRLLICGWYFYGPAKRRARAATMSCRPPTEDAVAPTDGVFGVTSLAVLTRWRMDETPEWIAVYLLTGKCALSGKIVLD